MALSVPGSAELGFCCSLLHPASQAPFIATFWTIIKPGAACREPSVPVTSVWGALWPAGGCRVRDNTARRREGAPADFRRQCRARPPPRARATRPRLFRTVGKAIGAEGVGASGAGGRTQSPRGSSPRAPSGSVPQDGARRRLSAPAQPRVLKLPGTPDSAREPTDPGARAGEVRRRRTGAKKTAAGFRSFQPLINLQSKSSEPSSLPSCSGDQAAAAPELSPYCPPATSSGIAGILPPTWRPRPAAGSACTCRPPALLRLVLYFHRDAVALHAEATSSASGPGTSAGSPGALGCKPGPAAAPSRRTSRGLPGWTLQTPVPPGEPEAGPRGSASPGQCPRRLRTCRRT